MVNQKIAAKTYKHFSNLEGNQHIASEFALGKIIDFISKYKVKSVLELGIGIGSISFCVLEFFKEKNEMIKYIGTESNEFCLSVLPKYLKSNFSNIEIFNNLNDVSTDLKFQMVIIDGKDENLLKIKELISKNGIIIIEGDRQPQLKLIKSIFPKHLYVRLISNRKNPNYGPFSSDDLIGGIQLIFINPTFNQKVNFTYNKVKTAILYRVRRLKNDK